ncbi:hypothetical protein PHYPSEUDO_013115 [Phytophthora pseudosyringae]|uniref:Uncharacterized protein n=1 Tax=Phytophthora pseudosyringae TaxID=221518 RepID=A0A8T1V8C5_9STRA|nr:hypothetical protein PHYPSEUDO_013115 [Phytophthora pseudosyringae]
MFWRLMDGVLEADPEYFEQRPDATKRMGIHPILKITSVLRVFAYAGDEEEAAYKLRVSRPEGHRPISIGELMSRINAIENSSRHFMLQEDLVDEVWRRYGEEDDS